MAIISDYYRGDNWGKMKQFDITVILIAFVKVYGRL